MIAIDERIERFKKLSEWALGMSQEIDYPEGSTIKLKEMYVMISEKSAENALNLAELVEREEALY